MADTPKLGKALLITGTDVSVGKTFVTAGLARVLKQRGLSVGVMKPVEIGWPREGGEWAIDVERLVRAAGVDDPPEVVNPYCYEDMIAPQLSADRLAEPIDFERIEESLTKLREKYDIVLVEGVGGLGVPLDDGLNLATLANHCGLDVLVVALAHVGTLNHTFLTCQYAKSEGLNVLGIVVNMLDRTVDDPTTATNPKMMERMNKVPIFGVLPLQEDADTLDKIVDACGDCFDVEKFLGSLGVEAPAES